ncbi:OmpA family protein [Pseudomonas sp. GD03842]|uniref:OmpA family protein n=1 Tax=unclassified Pseudomonas TaxID=196821 RepID=UPI000D3A5AF4|nr:MULTISPECIES: OmpA family protein [unclassified Pseudomonas]MDH0747498.1 OmpA family protein [Pseudomonas sp. GD03842]RAU49467.1 OmpA family protein [Pseudomonas sp. RIT 409]RAU55794.1 OmpA family protein [Pseudomonas sp. RIT 412]
MSMIRTALPLILVTSVLTGCAGLQKTDWPLCAAGGALAGGAVGAFQSASVAAGFGAAVGVMAGAYCWAHGDGDDDGDGVLNSVDKCPNTPKGTPVDATGCPIVTPAPEPVAAPVVQPKEEIITIRDVHFEFNKATLTPADKHQLDAVVTKLKTEAPNVQLHVSGHTDSVGSDAYNQKLSEKRAQSVTDYLVSAGIARSAFVSVEGDGESRPVADNKTAEGRALNRRVEIKINR